MRPTLIGMRRMEGNQEQAEVAASHSLTCLQPCIHSAAPTASADPIEDIEVEAFLRTLVDVAFAIAARISTEGEREQEIKE